MLFTVFQSPAAVARSSSYLIRSCSLTGTCPNRSAMPFWCKLAKMRKYARSMIWPRCGWKLPGLLVRKPVGDWQSWSPALCKRRRTDSFFAAMSRVWPHLIKKARRPYGLQTRRTKAQDGWSMGASGWHYVVPYDDDPEKALQKLRSEVFTSGEYGVSRQIDMFWSILSQTRGGNKFLFLAFYLAAKSFFAIDKTVRWIARGGRGPRSIDEAVEIAAEAGTHSILDIQSCGQTPDFGLAVPLSPARMRRQFGTDQPTVDDLQRVLDVAGDNVESWQCVCFPLYDNGTPVKWVFVGASGD